MGKTEHRHLVAIGIKRNSAAAELIDTFAGLRLDNVIADLGGPHPIIFTSGPEDLAAGLEHVRSGVRAGSYVEGLQPCF